MGISPQLVQYSEVHSNEEFQQSTGCMRIKYHQMQNLDEAAVSHIYIPGLAFLSANHIQDYFYVFLLKIQLPNVKTSLSVALVHATVETWAWPAAPTAPLACPRRLSARMTSLRSQKVWTEWRRGCPSSGIKLWLVLHCLWSFRKKGP